MDKYLNGEELERVRAAGFNEYGLRYPIEELKQVYPSNLSMEEVEKYVDAITFAKVGSDDVGFFRDQLHAIPPGQKTTVTVTGLGNLAYIALKMKDEQTRAVARQIYDTILSNMTHPYSPDTSPV
jgi:hypothetical protein